MPTGIITTLRTDKRYGFIRPHNSDGDSDVFFHGSALVDLTFDETLKERSVRYDVVPTPDGRSKAANVRAE